MNPNPITLDFPDHFETSRLLIRAPRAGDGAQLNAAVHESWEELRIWMPWAKTLPSLEESEANLRQAAARWIERSDLRLNLFSKATGELVGGSGLHRIDWNVPRMEIGYWQRTKFCGQGLMTEAVRAIAAFALEELGAQRVEICCDARNEPSRRVAERAGFGLEATLRNHARDNQAQLHDTLIFTRFPAGDA
ncbi:MAG TPA: GNAT family N-acetyltransferase [Abditibacterium sp.]|jgi:RimJ/RimL family protein N-acetyltransferase